MNKEKISILITNFNKEKFIEECILSCLNQNYNNLEIIIVDNSSTDRSMSIIKTGYLRTFSSHSIGEVGIVTLCNI